MSFTHLFFDIGGVLGTNGWDREQRAAAAQRFGLEPEEMEDRHTGSGAILEQGRMTLDQYLRCTVFHRPRRFTAEEFKEYMKEQSVPFEASIALAQELALTGRYCLMTINNESAELNRHRIAQFGLRRIFVAFFSSCWVGSLKPDPRIFEVALEISQANPGSSVFIDDRASNLEPARALGMNAVQFTDVARLRHDLTELGVRP